jgi:adenylosuccinate synthase
MSIAVVVGAQYGGEGKGKVTAHLCREKGYDIAVRCGGPNSGHTVSIDNEQVVLRQIPAGVNADSRLLVAAGCLIDLEVLNREIAQFGLDAKRLGISPNAVIVNKSYAEEEQIGGLGSRIGSTCTGTGIAVAKRALRTNDIQQARDIPELKDYLKDVACEVDSANSKGAKIVIEGTQGFGLSLYHSVCYPYATSRDTSASAFLSEVGVSPLEVSDVIMVMRTFPIRVGGNSGPLPNEINWQTIRNESGYPYEIQEFTTVTKKLRRVARFDMQLIKQAMIINKPNHLALMGIDYLDYKNKSVFNYDEISEQTKAFILNLEHELGVHIDLIGVGPTDYEVIDRWENMSYEQKRRRKAAVGKLSNL